MTRGARNKSNGNVTGGVMLNLIATLYLSKRRNCGGLHVQSKIWGYSIGGNMAQ